MAVSCYECDYLLKVLEEQFVLNDGDPRWLQLGLQAAEPKLQVIAPFNETLAHRPWVLYTDEIEVSTSSKHLS